MRFLLQLFGRGREKLVHDRFRRAPIIGWPSDAIMPPARVSSVTQFGLGWLLDILDFGARGSGNQKIRHGFQHFHTPGRRIARLNFPLQGSSLEFASPL
jgi:hypothetical protein